MEKAEKLDFLDKVLSAGFIICLVTICALNVLQAPVSEVVENITWGLALALGAKKLPQKL